MGQEELKSKFSEADIKRIEVVINSYKNQSGTTFGLISDEYELISTIAGCRAYVTDCFFVKQYFENTKNALAYGGAMNDFRPAVKKFNIHNPIFLVGKIHPRAIELLNELEEKNNLEKTIFNQCGFDDQLFVLTSDYKWSQSSHLISAYFAFMRVFNGVLIKDLNQKIKLNKDSFKLDELFKEINTLNKNKEIYTIGDGSFSSISVASILYVYENLKSIIEEAMSNPREKNYTLEDQDKFLKENFRNFYGRVHNYSGIDVLPLNKQANIA